MILSLTKEGDSVRSGKDCNELSRLIAAFVEKFGSVEVVGKIQEGKAMVQLKAPLEVWAQSPSLLQISTAVLWNTSQTFKTAPLKMQTAHLS